MLTILNIIRVYRDKLDSLDLELIISHALNKPHEFVLVHPEYKLSQKQAGKIKKYVQRRINKEPLAYILGYKEFYGLDFKVNKNVLIPRPETEMLIEEVLKMELKNATIIDVGTGSGNIIVAIAHSFKFKILNLKFFGTDISKSALNIAKQNALKHRVDQKIKFLQGNLLKPILDTRYLSTSKTSKIQDTNIIIVANLPYLSKKIYSSASLEIKNYEPRLALLNNQDGLSHYKNLFQQIRKIHYALCIMHTTIFLEFSPEQKAKIEKLARKYFPHSKINFKKDLARKWRLAVIKLG